jgi:NADH-quinone oxidoreductase subunit L
MALAAIVLAAPFACFALLGLVPRLRRTGRPAAHLSILGTGASSLAALALLRRFLEEPAPQRWEFVWLPLGRTPITCGVLLDGLSVPMLALVSLVALLVQVYSLEYMRAESPGSLGRYYAYHCLFAFAMLGLVVSPTTVQAYGFWELVGLGSYLLIGFWYRKPEAARAARKAFWTTRLGDVGFAVGVVLLWAAAGTFAFEELFRRADQGLLAGGLLTAGVTGLLVGAMGKSAQFPLHIWLPDAMEGPTPVSALIHAATMVAAGVYLMVRSAPLLSHVPAVALAALGVGAFTALLAASMALVASDIKRILAFSTVSQLGYMLAAAGAGAGAASFFHLTTHAFFKALLFLTAGSVIHAVHTNDVFGMGRLWRRMPLTGTCFLIGGLALCGVWPTAGFFSKDEILLALWDRGHTLAFWSLLATAGLTACYTARAFFLVFFGERTCAAPARESPAAMLVPMGVLAALAVAGGALGHPLAELVGHSLSRPAAAPAAGAAAMPVGLLGLVAAAAGFAVAWLGYQARVFRPDRLLAALGPLGRLIERRYLVDEAFVALYRVLYLALGKAIGWLDRYVVDGAVNLLTWLVGAAAVRLRAAHTGRVQDALYAVAAGVLLLALLALEL